ncbi:MAG: hypothetical protein A2Y17_11780 [Clostridiales bacterium GWF2_38_85]|nr:MAG: hypothetical protein A2Y17_11780 [Clostridiales bacterium GWF2_38_85]HBL85382.1 hypothetical protein [Clostridiales bacterium]
MIKTKTVHQIKFIDITMEKAVEYAEILYHSDRPSAVFTPNSLMVLDCLKNKSFLDIINSSDMNLPDGQGIIWAAKRLGSPLQQKIAGVDFAKKMLESLNNKNGSLFILGGEKNSLENAFNNIRQQYKNILCDGCDGYYTDEKMVIDKINSITPDVIFVCLGSPKQEYFICNNKQYFKRGLFVGLGGTVDILSGEKKRAPKIMIDLSLEWLWRAVIEPKRFRKLIKLPKFIYNTIIEKDKHNS